MKKLWIFTEVFYPEETSTAFILTKIANKLATKYNVVNVVCASEVNDKENLSSEFSSNVCIKRFNKIFNDKNSLIIRSLGFIELSIKFFLILLFNVKKNDKVFLVTNPVPLVLIVSLLKKLKKFEVVLLVHDVFPENTLSANIFKSENTVYFKFLKFIFDKSYQNMSKIIVLGRDMKDVVEQKIKFKKTPEVIVIENWGENHKIYPKIRKDNDNIVFQYAGNIGRVQGLDFLLKVISEIKNSKLIFEIFGNGVEKSNLIKLVEKYQLKNVYFYDSYKRDEQNDIINRADIAIVTLSKGMYGLGVPSKFYNILTAGKPVLYIGEENTEIHQIMNEFDIGYFFKPDEKENLLEFFETIKIDNSFIKKGENARNLLLNNYTEEIILEKYLKEI